MHLHKIFISFSYKESKVVEERNKDAMSLIHDTAFIVKKWNQTMEINKIIPGIMKKE